MDDPLDEQFKADLENLLVECALLRDELSFQREGILAMLRRRTAAEAESGSADG